MHWPIPLHHFAAGSRAHALVLLVTALVVLALIRAGQRLQPRPVTADPDDGPAPAGRRPGAFLTALAAAALAAWAAGFARDLLPDRRSWGNSLPLHLCDVTGLLAVAALYTGRRPVRAVLYFWAFAFSAQAFTQPIVRVGMAHVDFWLYWVTHGAIVAAAAYDVAVLGFRPRLADCRLAVLATLAYIAVVLPVDAALGVNYGYLGDTGGTRQTLVASFGPWPARIPLLAVVAAAVMTLLVLPWELAAWWRDAGQHAATAAASAAADGRLPVLPMAARA
jgi:hypothetical integral membrane protein (TIGR02206 family)